jgi:hypothetical protein
MSLLGTLFAGRSKDWPPEVMDAPDEALIRKDIGRLDEVRPGLGEQVIDYICRGENDSVLLMIGAVRGEASTVLSGGNYFSSGKWISGRSDFLLAAQTWRPDVIRRYGQVLSQLYDGATWPSLPGTDRTLAWLRNILMHYRESRAAITAEAHWKTAPPARAKEPWSIDKLKSLLGEDESPILDVAFERDEGGYYSRSADLVSPEQMPGFEAHLLSDPARRTAEMRGLSAKARAYGLRLLARQRLTDGAWFDFAFEQAGDAAKSVREAAVLVLRGAAPAALAERTLDGWSRMKPPHRIEIARIVQASCGADAPALLRGLLETETNDSVRAELQRHLDQDGLGIKAGDGRVDGADGYTALDGDWVAAPTLKPLPEDRPVSSALRDLIAKVYAVWREEAELHNRTETGGRYFYLKRVPPKDAANTASAIMDGQPLPKSADRTFIDLFWHVTPNKSQAASVAQILAHPDLTLWHLARCAYADGPEGRKNGYSESIVFDTPVASAMRARLDCAADFRTYEALIERLGCKSPPIVQQVLGANSWRVDLESLPPASVWPTCLAQFALIDEALGLVPPSGKETLVEAKALELLALLPKTPARYVSALLDRAISGRKTVRQPARALLASAPNLLQILMPLLQHPKSETRAGTAVWLADRKEVGAIAMLLDAARVEKLLGPKAALIGAAARLGGDIGEFVSAEALISEAEAGLKKTPLKGLDWFPFDGMPVLKQASGDVLDPQILRWWIVLAAKLKQPGGSRWFELLLNELDPASAARVGLAVMSAWIAYDTVRPSDAEANAYAAAEVERTFKKSQHWDTQILREQVFASARQWKLREYFNSGADQRGVLALATRASGLEAVSMVRSYFRDHYSRTAQCKALLECLAANPSPLAIQYVLAISKRWRTRTVQEKAAELVANIAEARGWTPEQLADRTIPTGGFDDDGRLELPVGDKTYTAHLDAAGAISLRNPDGKPVQGLPASASGDAAESLKASKAALSEARKAIKQVFDFQLRRLYEALCAGREWPVADWSDFLLHHPLMTRLVQRLIWLGLDAAGERIATFRPMEDLTLTDSVDGPVDLDRIAHIRLAHSTGLSDAEQAAWRRHLDDYEVAPLFDQLGRSPLTADDLEQHATEIVDRKGWMIDAFKLRSAATKLGYIRGEAEDGGTFFTYEKAFDALRLVAVLEFTGNGLPEENRPSALLGLRFAKMGKGTLHWSVGVPLSSVPPVLLSEAWNDVHQIAAAGTGFDADWETKSGW